MLIIGLTCIDCINNTSRIQYQELLRSGIFVFVKNVLFIGNLFRNKLPFHTWQKFGSYWVWHILSAFLYSSGIDICICLVSFTYDTYDNFTHLYPIYGFLFVEFWFGICSSSLCVCQGCQTISMILSIQCCHFPQCLQLLFRKWCCHFPLPGIWLDSAGSEHITI